MVREYFLAEYRTRQLEPLTPGQIDRLVTSALAHGAESVATRVAGRRVLLDALHEPSQRGSDDRSLCDRGRPL